MRLREVVWAAKEYRHETEYVTSFDTALADPLWKIARDDPSSLSVTDVELWLVGFLNAWRCRLDYSISASLRSAVVDVHPLCQQLIREGMLRKEIVARVFDTVCRARNERREVGPVATSKALGMLYPECFCIWDSTISIRYGHDWSGAGYADFVEEMYAVWNFLEEEWRSLGGETETLISRVSRILRRKCYPMKILDEYNWLTLTRKKVPPTELSNEILELCSDD